MTIEPTNDEAELAAWTADVGPNEWVRDREWRYPSPGLDAPAEPKPTQ